MAPRVVFIAGAPRSGSTLLSILLGRHPAVVNVGEVRILPQRWAHGDRCGCGLPLPDCPFWAEVAEGSGSEPTRVRDQRDLYARASRVAGADVVVDASKDPAYVASVARPGDLVVHLVRDPRSLAWSSHRLGRRLDPRPDQPPHPTLRAVALLTVSWRNDNRGASRLGGTTIRYEDLAVDPEGVCADLWRSLDLEPVTGTWGVQHYVGGSARVRQLGEVEVALDDEWTRELPRSHRALAWTLALPYARRAGYRFR